MNKNSFLSKTRAWRTASGDLLRRTGRLKTIACLFPLLLAACAGRSPGRDIEQVVADRYGGELLVLDVRRLHPSAPLARWTGVHGVYLQDRADDEKFMVRLAKDESAATLTDKIPAARRDMRQFVAHQKAALAQLQAAGLQGEAFTLKAQSPIHGGMRWKVAYFADMDALRRGEAPLGDAALQSLGRIVDAGLAPQPDIGIYPASSRTDYLAPLNKGYHGMIEFIGGEPQTFMQSLEDGADLWWTVDATASAAPHIVTERQADLREACYAAIAAMRGGNYFFARHGIYLQPRFHALQAHRIADRLRDAGLRQGHTAYALLDRTGGRLVLRGIVAQDALQGSDPYVVEAVYEYEFAFATGEMQVRRLPG